MSHQVRIIMNRMPDREAGDLSPDYSIRIHCFNPVRLEHAREIERDVRGGRRDVARRVCTEMLESLPGAGIVAVLDDDDVAKYASSWTTAIRRIADAISNDQSPQNVGYVIENTRRWLLKLIAKIDRGDNWEEVCRDVHYHYVAYASNTLLPNLWFLRPEYSPSEALVVYVNDVVDLSMVHQLDGMVGYTGITGFDKPIGWDDIDEDGIGGPCLMLISDTEASQWIESLEGMTDACPSVLRNEFEFFKTLVRKAANGELLFVVENML